MASKLQQYSDYEEVDVVIPELSEFFLYDVTRKFMRIGSGSMPLEELAMGKTLCVGKPVIKYVKLLDKNSEGYDRTTLSECELISKIRHPNIVQFLGWCIINDYLVLVMEKLDFSLEFALDTYSNLPLPFVLRILKDIASGLVYLHSNKPPIIHCDLTARNVLIDKASLRAKIGNLRNAITADTYPSFELPPVPRTTACMPPEALTSKPNYDVTLDMFSFGHLALYAVIQKSPCDLLNTRYKDPHTRKLKVRSEVEQRSKYINLLVTKLTKDHTITKMILKCLDNLPEKRYNMDTNNSCIILYICTCFFTLKTKGSRCFTTNYEGLQL